jgi:hypothetical protein
LYSCLFVFGCLSQPNFFSINLSRALPLLFSKKNDLQWCWWCYSLYRSSSEFQLNGKLAAVTILAKVV